ncbi:hypothetical protein BDP55DRAFT_634686 [Colletotrichum godetiae]|uniref:Uncharacterized protein n=1 Tax=Colletotrichum godetiae TaxID=1209918 RepID=A0AAJ0ERE4_9PEZI|nr:uncharacterized protein BDP55DRAFT_634686 [Colletotrichum godetiae]KAK1672667.1 hypothetical protein BDP55DRAFT_634686 [Colletotrichum godetiae]
MTISLSGALSLLWISKHEGFFLPSQNVLPSLTDLANPVESVTPPHPESFQKSNNHVDDDLKDGIQIPRVLPAHHTHELEMSLSPVHVISAMYRGIAVQNAENVKKQKSKEMRDKKQNETSKIGKS